MTSALILTDLGDVEGFVLDDCCRLHAFKTRERDVGLLAIKRCADRLSVFVFAERRNPSKLHRLTIRA